MVKKKYYVVWKGVSPGIYESWTACQLQIKGVIGAKFKSFTTRKLAEEAYNSIPEDYIGKTNKKENVDSSGCFIDNNETIITNSLAVDAACSGNPGVMEYQGVFVETSTQVFYYKAALGTNNIGEFLALVHGLAYLKQNKLSLPIYSDSKIAINWIKQKKCKTKLKKTEKTAALYAVIARAEKWLNEHKVETKIMKWNTKEWGEIPADFGRK